MDSDTFAPILAEFPTGGTRCDEICPDQWLIKYRDCNMCKYIPNTQWSWWYLPTWVFPKIRVPPNHPLKNRVFHEINHPFWGVYHPYFWFNTHIYSKNRPPPKKKHRRFRFAICPLFGLYLPAVASKASVAACFSLRFVRLFRWRNL